VECVPDYRGKVIKVINVEWVALTLPDYFLPLQHHPTEMGGVKITAFLTHLAIHKVSHTYTNIKHFLILVITIRKVLDY